MKMWTNTQTNEKIFENEKENKVKWRLAAEVSYVQVLETLNCQNQHATFNEYHTVENETIKWMKRIDIWMKC